MKGLLLKDLLTMTKQTKLYALMIVIFSVIPGYSMAAFALAYSALLPITAIAYDERSKWDHLAAMMPYSPMQLVLSKYLLSWAAVLAAFLLTASAQSVTALLRGSFSAAAVLRPLVMSLALSLLLPAVSLPLIFRFGVERGRIGFLALMVLFALASTVFGNIVRDGLPHFNIALVTLILYIAAIAGSVLSIYISARLYPRRS